MASSHRYRAKSPLSLAGWTAGDYDGDGKSDLAVFEYTTGNWYIFCSSTEQLTQTKFGNSECTLVSAGDYDGDGRTDIAVYERSTGYW